MLSDCWATNSRAAAREKWEFFGDGDEVAELARVQVHSHSRMIVNARDLGVWVRVGRGVSCAGVLLEPGSGGDPRRVEEREMTVENGSPKDGLERNALGTASIVFLVLAAVTPMAAVVGVVPLGVFLGDGAGFPGAYVIAGVLLLLFAVGFAAMGRYVTNAGAFYAYIARGIGRPAGGAAAGVAVIAYNAIMISVVGGFGYFAHSILSRGLGITLPWQVWVAILLAVLAVLGTRQVEISAKILAVALTCEMLILLILDVAILGTRGVSAFSLHSFAPSAVFSGAPGVALVYAFFTFVGFEATAISAKRPASRERHDPAGDVHRGQRDRGVDTLTSWSLVAGYSAGHVKAAAAGNAGNFVFDAELWFVGSVSTHAIAPADPDEFVRCGAGAA